MSRHNRSESITSRVNESDAFRPHSLVGDIQNVPLRAFGRVRAYEENQIDPTAEASLRKKLQKLDAGTLQLSEPVTADEFREEISRVSRPLKALMRAGRTRL